MIRNSNTNKIHSSIKRLGRYIDNLTPKDVEWTMEGRCAVATHKGKRVVIKYAFDKDVNHELYITDNSFADDHPQDAVSMAVYLLNKEEKQ